MYDKLLKPPKSFRITLYLTSSIHNAKIRTKMRILRSVVQCFVCSSFRLISPVSLSNEAACQALPIDRAKKPHRVGAALVRCGGLLTLCCTSGLLLVEGTSSNGHSPMTLPLCVYRCHSGDFTLDDEMYVACQISPLAPELFF